jgi:hypothetical protein
LLCLDPGGVKLYAVCKQGIFISFEPLCDTRVFYVAPDKADFPVPFSEQMLNRLLGSLKIIDEYCRKDVTVEFIVDQDERRPSESM